MWVVRHIHKTESDEAIKKVLSESKVLSGRGVRYLRTDGDGIFGRSKGFQSLQAELGFIHERPSPYDHNQSSVVDRECRTLLEGTSTNLHRAGAPATFWGEAADHFIFTRNHMPRHEIVRGANIAYISPHDFHAGRNTLFSLKNLVAFGTQVTCYIPKARREGGKARRKKKLSTGCWSDM